MQLEIVKNQNGRKITIAPKGMINTNTVSAFSDALDSLDYDGLDLTLDFSGLSYITSAGLRALLIVRKRLTEDTMRIVGMNEAVHEVFRVSGFLGFIPVVSASGMSSLPDDPSYRQYLSYRVKTDPDHQIFICDGKGYTWLQIDRASQIAAKSRAETPLIKPGSSV